MNANDKNDRADPISQGNPPDDEVSLLPAVIERIASLERRVSRLEMRDEDDTTGD